MSTQTAMLCTKCKEVLNSEDYIFGTSCGHLYHFLCLRECHGRSTNCSHCESYKPCMFKMFLEFGEATQPISWEDQTRTIELHSELEESKRRLANVEEKHKFSLVEVQKLEGKLKKLNDTLNSRDITVSDLEDRIATLEVLNQFLSTETELVKKNNNGIEEKESSKPSKNQMKKNNKKIQHLSEQLKKEMEINTKMLKENMRLQAFINETNNENGKNIANPTDASGINENGENSKDNSKHCQEIVPDTFLGATDTDTEQIAATNEHIGENSIEGNEEQSSNNPESTSDYYKVVINNYLIQNLVNPLENVIISIASRMDLTLTASDISSVITIKNNFKIATLVVFFGSIHLKNKFLMNKNRLKKFKHTKYLDIQ